MAEDGGRVVGYVHLTEYRLLYEKPLMNIMGIAVALAYRRQGIGKALLLAAEDWARASKAAGVRPTSGETRVGAHAFYRSLGYAGTKMQLNLRKMFD